MINGENKSEKNTANLPGFDFFQRFHFNGIFSGFENTQILHIFIRLKSYNY